MYHTALLLFPVWVTKGIVINEKFEDVISETNHQRNTSRVFSKLLLSINKTACSNELSWKRVTNDVKVN